MRIYQKQRHCADLAIRPQYRSMSLGKHMSTALVVLKGYFPFGEASGVLRYGHFLHGMDRHGDGAARLSWMR